MQLTITEATSDSLDAFLVLADEVGEWLWYKGVKQWRPGFHHANRAHFAHLVEHGSLILAHHQGRLAGGCILTAIVPNAWPAAEGVLALNALAVARWAAGAGVGRLIIAGCVTAGAQQGKARIRLDCWEGNAFLKEYYQSEGFAMLGVIQAAGYEVRLFEKLVA